MDVNSPEVQELIRSHVEKYYISNMAKSIENIMATLQSELVRSTVHGVIHSRQVTKSKSDIPKKSETKLYLNAQKDYKQKLPQEEHDTKEWMAHQINARNKSGKGDNQIYNLATQRLVKRDTCTSHGWPIVDVTYNGIPFGFTNGQSDIEMHASAKFNTLLSMIEKTGGSLKHSITVKTPQVDEMSMLSHNQPDVDDSIPFPKPLEVTPEEMNKYEIKKESSPESLVSDRNIKTAVQDAIQELDTSGDGITIQRLRKEFSDMSLPDLKSIVLGLMQEGILSGDLKSIKYQYKE